MDLSLSILEDLSPQKAAEFILILYKKLLGSSKNKVKVRIKEVIGDMIIGEEIEV